MFDSFASMRYLIGEGAVTPSDLYPFYSRARIAMTVWITATTNEAIASRSFCFSSICYLHGYIVAYIDFIINYFINIKAIASILCSWDID